MSYPHILARLINTPLLIEESKLDILTRDVSLVLLAGGSLDMSLPSQSADEPTLENKIAIIPVFGSLVNKNGAGASGYTSYSRIKSNILYEIEQGATTIGFDISSGGGEAGGVFSLATFIRQLPSKGIKTFAYTDSHMNSAAYIIGASAEQIYVTDIADVGSIGAVMSLVDLSESDKKEGIKYTILRSKENKAGYNPHEELSDSVKKDLLAKLVVLDTKFNETMLEYRTNLTLETITSLAGGTVTGTKAVELGLADHLVTTIEDVIDLYVNPQPAQATTNKGINNMTLEEALQKNVELQGKYDTLLASTNIDKAKAVAEERSRCMKVIEAGKAFSAVSQTTIMNAVSKGYSLDMVADMFTDMQANADAASGIDTSGASLGSADAIAKAAAKAAKEDPSAVTAAGGLFKLSDLFSEGAK